MSILLYLFQADLWRPGPVWRDLNRDFVRIECFLKDFDIGDFPTGFDIVDLYFVRGS